MGMFIMLLAMLVVLMIVVFLFIQQGTAKKSIIFGVALPEHALQHPQIQHLQSAYRRHYYIHGTVSLLTTLPVIWLERFMSMALVYLLMWVAVFLYTSLLPFQKYNRLATELKRDNSWFVGETKVISLESEIQRLKLAKHVSPLWFSIPVLISLGLLFASISNESSLLKITGVSSLVVTGVIFGLYYTFRHMKPKVYSSNHKLNAAINRTSSRYWSMLWLLMAVFESLNAIVAYWILTSGISSDFSLWLIGMAMVSLVPLGAILFVHRQIRLVEERLSTTNGESIVVDDDVYWVRGMTYYNPDQKDIFVPKRLGTGMTVNLATTAGKWIQYGSLVLAAAIIIPTVAFFIVTDHSTPELLIAESGQRITIEYPQYESSFELSDIEELSLEDSVPSGFRSNGVATSQYARGHFKLEELGETALYIFKNTPPYIVIKLEDSYIIYNEQDPELTKSLFEDLKEPWLALQPKTPVAVP